MEQTQIKQKKVITLIGRLITPIVVSQPTYWKHGCIVKVFGDPNKESKPRFTSVGKLVYGKRDYPSVLRGYRGYVKIIYISSSEEQLKRKIEWFLQKKFIGTKTSEGFGRINWESCEIQEYNHKSPILHSVSLSKNCPQCSKKTVIYDKIAKLNHCTSCNQTWQPKKFKIRAGLRANYPKKLKKLLLTLMLHDFVHTQRHQSKIYHEVTIEDDEIQEACLNHHNGEVGNNILLPLVKHYDGLASFITRKKPYQTKIRYDKSKGKLDFQKLKQEIEKRQDSHIKLYDFIYNSQELKRIVESTIFGKNSLRNHLLLMVNLAINDFYDKKLKVVKGKISLSASKREELVTVMDAEMHSFSDHDTANSERATTSKKRQLEA